MGGRVNLVGARITECFFGQGNRFTLTNQTLSGTTALQRGGPNVYVLDPGGAGRNVTLWASPQLGDFVIIINAADAAEVLTIQTSAGGALVPPITPTQSETAIIVYCGAVLGWRGLVAIGV